MRKTRKVARRVQPILRQVNCYFRTVLRVWLYYLCVLLVPGEAAAKNGNNWMIGEHPLCQDAQATVVFSKQKEVPTFAVSRLKKIKSDQFPQGESNL